MFVCFPLVCAFLLFVLFLLWPCLFWHSAGFCTSFFVAWFSVSLFFFGVCSLALVLLLLWPCLFWHSAGFCTFFFLAWFFVSLLFLGLSCLRHSSLFSSVSVVCALRSSLVVVPRFISTLSAEKPSATCTTTTTTFYLLGTAGWPPLPSPSSPHAQHG